MTGPAEERALVAELQAAGHALDSIWDWVNHPVYAPAAVPILIAHLERSRDERLVEAIARVLTDRRYREAEELLVRVFPRAQNNFVRWAIANALSVVGFGRSEEAVLAFCADERFGFSRELLVGALYRIKRPEVEPFLIALLADPVLDCFAATALARRGSRTALEALEGLDLSGRSPRTRKTVPKAIARLRARLAGA